jgi:hypothetical protein
LGAHDQLSCTVFTPAAGGQFTLSFTGTDEFGCPQYAQTTFVCATAAQMAWADELCKMKHLISKYWRFIRPLWDPLRDFSTRPVDHGELRRMKELIRQMEGMVSLLERQPSANRDLKRNPKLPAETSRSADKGSASGGSRKRIATGDRKAPM